MFGKNWKTRWDDAVKYLNDNTPSRIGAHVEQVVASEAKRKEISKQLSLGSRSDGEDDPAFATKTQQRLALRALMLCQRVYYGADTWAKVSKTGGNTETVGLEPAVADLVPDWKTKSMTYWAGQGEAAILQGILMFDMVPGATALDVQTAAYAGKPNGTALMGNLTLSRANAVTVGFGVVCYVGVQGWLVRSGVVSMRWFMQCSAPNGKVGCDLLFGEGRLVWNGPITPDDHRRVRRVCNAVPAGHVVHIWSPANSNWNGHWLIANGDVHGTACGVNNGVKSAEKAERGLEVDVKYTNSTTLFEQFIGYSNTWTDGENVERRTTAKMAVMDPLTMPTRM